MKKNYIAFVCLLVSLFSALGCQTLAEVDETTVVNRGWRHHRRGNYNWAILDFEGTLKRHPQSTQALGGLAMTWEDLGDYEKAKEYFSKVIALDPRSKFYYDIGSNKVESADIRRGWRYYRYGEFSSAIAAFSSALEKNPQSAEAYVGLAMAWDDRPGSDYDKAIKYFSKAIELEPKSGYFWLRGEVWMKKKDFARGIEDYTSAINRDPGFAAAYTDRGFCYMSIGKYERALMDYKKALELIPVGDQRPYALRVRKIALEAIRDLQKKAK